jgi:DNA polymerase-3 subunit delta
MAERRVVVVRDASALRKDVRAEVDRFLARSGAAASAADDVVLVLVYAAGKPDRVVTEGAYTVEMEPLTGDRVPRWIVHHARTVLGVEITPGAAALLFESAGNDLVVLASELDKLASYAGGAAIDEAAVAAIVGVRRGETLGDFLDLVATRDATRALALLTHVLGQPKVGAIPIVMALTTQTLALAWGRAMRERGVSAARLEREYFDFLKSTGGAYTGRPWGEAVKSWARVVDDWDEPVLERTLEALLAADVSLKETRLSSDDEILARLVLAICVGDDHTTMRRRTAVA